MTTHGLTRRMRETLSFIRAYIGRHGTSPSYDEIRAHIGLASKSGVMRLINELVDRGHITKRDRKGRSLALTAANSEANFSVTDEKLQAQLALYCLATNQDPQEVIHDAVALFIDADTDHTQVQEDAACPPA